jgi:hypothetical protein
MLGVVPAPIVIFRAGPFDGPTAARRGAQGVVRDVVVVVAVGLAAKYVEFAVGEGFLAK